jgi:hypothetical protein
MLGREDRAILDFEATWWREPGAKDQAIEFSLGLTAAAYYEHLLALVAGGPAMAYDPLTVRRILMMIDPVVDQEVAVS